jgi:hypothetical protein
VVFGAQKNKEEQNMRRKLNDEKSWIFGESPSNPAVHLNTFLILGFYYSTSLADPSDIASFRPLSYSYTYDIK